MNKQFPILSSVISEGISIYGSPKTRCGVGFTNPSLMTQRGFGRFHLGMHMKEIPLTRGKVALVNDEDFEELSKFKWYAIKARHTFYAVREIRPDGKRESRTSEYMHRRILGATRGEQVDHENHNGLDCQRHNLRTCTPSQNSFNQRKCRKGTNKYKGVYWWERDKKWNAKIGFGGKHINLGYFTSAEEAAHARDAKAKELHGGFAVLNFPIK